MRVPVLPEPTPWFPGQAPYEICSGYRLLVGGGNNRD
jgi:hypothetical protein